MNEEPILSLMTKLSPSCVAGASTSYDNLLRWSDTANGIIVELLSDPVGEHHRWCDRYILVIPHNQHDRDVFFKAFFNTIANQFADTASVVRNRDNIYGLLKMLRDNNLLHRDDRVFDFGCGTGWSANISEDFGISIVGFDYSQAMREHARSSGMMVLDDINDLAGEPLFDCAIASYVCHLETGEKSLQQLPGLLKPGGGLCVNFHKGHGRDWTDRILVGNGLVYCDERESESGHGHLVAYLKI